MKFTGNKDTDRLVLNKLSDKDLMAICRSNKSWRDFCNTDQTLWQNRLYQKFGNILESETIEKYKKKYGKWSDYYIDLRSINKNNRYYKLIEGSKNGRLDYVIISLKEGANMYMQHLYGKTALDLAVEYGYLDIIKYLIETKHQQYFNDHLIRRAKMESQKDVVKYLKSIKGGF